ncbi:hypothetical protein [Actinocrispum sp. NPDC049592]|uniref:hypothetical protein n=1 Tax=Actinocrispum sp. NPDC049592 TaxID=3154835 RepID=UPI003433D023
MEPLNRLADVHTNVKAALAVLAVATLAACGDKAGAGAGRPCTDIGTPVGVSVDVDKAYADKTEAATLKVCWDGNCQSAALVLTPSSVAVPGPCTETSADAACGAHAVPTGGKNGFATITDLPAKPVDATLSLTNMAGTSVLEKTLRITPKEVRPNGPDCPGGGPQTGLQVSADGTMTER